MLESVLFSGISQDDIQRLFEEAVKPYAQKGKVSAIWLDATYAYTFAKDDVSYMAKLCKLGRYNFADVVEWHRLNERWFQDQTVRDDRGMIFEPMKIVRSFDKIPNEGLVKMSRAYVGLGDDTSFNWHAWGKGVGLVRAFASDTIMSDEVERIDVFDTPAGGSLSLDGTTIYAVGNHTIDMPGEGENLTETGLFNVEDKTVDVMGDHSILPDGIPHTQGEDAPGSTTIIFPCSV